MARRERIKKPEPERTSPIRSWGTLFSGIPGAAAPPQPESNGAADPITQGVQAGYRVIEDYVRQWQSAARLMWGPMLPTPTPTATPGAGGAPGLGNGEEMQQRFGVMVRTMTDMATLWLDFLGSAPWARMPGFMGMPGMPGAKPTPPPGSTPAPPFSAGTPPEPSPAPARSNGHQASNGHAAPAISVDVTSRRRTEVILDLRPLSAEGVLRVHDLRAPDPAAPRLCGATIAGVPGEDRVVVRLAVPDDHPPGLYSGLILDERTSLP